MLGVKGDVVTADAMNCRKETAKKIRKKGANYIVSVKENRKGLYNDIKEYFEGMESEIRELPEDVYGRGRRRKDTGAFFGKTNAV
jgi:predicted transposase YbfD/YdcC